MTMKQKAADLLDRLSQCPVALDPLADHSDYRGMPGKVAFVPVALVEELKDWLGEKT